MTDNEVTRNTYALNGLVPVRRVPGHWALWSRVCGLCENTTNMARNDSRRSPIVAHDCLVQPFKVCDQWRSIHDEKGETPTRTSIILINQTIHSIKVLPSKGQMSIEGQPLSP
jgi:hypothetical protein